MSIPELRRGSGAALLDISDTGAQESFVLFLHVNFAIRSRDLRGHIAAVMDLPSLAALKALLRQSLSSAPCRSFVCLVHFRTGRVRVPICPNVQIEERYWSLYER